MPPIIQDGTLTKVARLWTFRIDSLAHYRQGDHNVPKYGQVVEPVDELIQRIDVYLPPELAEVVKAKARQERRSNSAQMVCIVEQWLEQRAEKVPA